MGTSCCQRRGAARSGEILQDAAPNAYLRSLQTADDVEGRVRVLVHLEGGEEGIHVKTTSHGR